MVSADEDPGASDEHSGSIQVQESPLSGFCEYDGIMAMQNAAVFSVFREFLRLTRPARILEIGTAHGGLTLFLRHTLDELGLSASTIRTCDLVSIASHSRLRATAGIEVLTQNLFTHSYKGIRQPQLVFPFLRLPGRVVVLCDGGSKPDEFRLLAPHLKPGDVIMAHDYAPDRRYFEEHILNRHWNWLEIQDDDVAEVCLASNLEPFMQEAFLPVVWLCRQRGEPRNR
ncbi:MAG: hypothetical protein AB8B57_10225 [Congregibacter sp.]